MAADQRRNETASTLPAHRAFVVHFRGADRVRRFAGRVEHLASGQFSHFGSLRELRGFFARLLDEPRKP